MNHDPAAFATYVQTITQVNDQADEASKDAVAHGGTRALAAATPSITARQATQSTVALAALLAAR